MRKKFLVRGKVDEFKIREILNPIIQGVERTTHKVTYWTRKGVVDYISVPLGSSIGRYDDANLSDTLNKIFLWNRDTTDELEQMLRSNNVEMVEIIKDGPKTLELLKE